MDGGESRDAGSDVEVQKAVQGLDVGNIVTGGEFGCYLWVAGVEGYARGGSGGEGDDQLGGGERAERGREGIVLVKKETGGDEAGPGVVGDHGVDVADRGIEDECREFVVLGGEARGEGGSDTLSEGDDAAGRNAACRREVRECGVGVGLHEGFGGMVATRGAEAAVVE